MQWTSLARGQNMTWNQRETHSRRNPVVSAILFTWSKRTAPKPPLCRCFIEKGRRVKGSRGWNSPRTTTSRQQKNLYNLNSGRSSSTFPQLPQIYEQGDRARGLTADTRRTAQWTCHLPNKSKKVINRARAAHVGEVPAVDSQRKF